MTLLAVAACGGRTPPFRDAEGRPVANSIAEESYVDVNGTQQWLLVRGRDARSPVLLVLHGGPGSSETVLFRHFVGAALENRPVVAYWDQRGAGRSYSPSIPPDTMTVAQFLADADAIVDHLRRRLGHDRIALLAHSWGSALGALYAARHADKLSAYLGVAQIASMPDGESVSYAATLGEARRRQDAKAVSELGTVGTPPHTVEAMWTLRHWEAVYGGEFATPPARWSFVLWALSSGEASLLDLWRLWRGSDFTMRAMWHEVQGLEVARDAPAIGMPSTFLLGRRDGIVPPALSAAYFAALRAPSKQLTWFEHSAHNPPFEEPDVFVRTAFEALGLPGAPPS